MSLSSVPFDDINESHLRDLIANGVSESRELDYKRDLYGGTDEGKKEFLRDVTAFANASGGYLVIGMEESGGVPVDLPGFPSANVDVDLQRYENLARDGVEPRIIGLRMKAIALASGKHAMVLNIPKSWNPPHRANFKSTKKFFTRNSSGCHEVSVEELRALFTVSADLAERIRMFRIDRLSKIKANETPIPMKSDGVGVLHIVPVLSFDQPSALDVSAASELNRNFQPLSMGGSRGKVNLDGVYFSYERGYGTVEENEYSLIFRNGCIEAVFDGRLEEYRDNLWFPWRAFYKDLFRELPNYLNGLSTLGIQPPYAVMMSFMGFRGASIQIGPMSKGTIKDRDDVVISAVTLNTSTLTDDWHHLIRPSLDELFNAFGVMSALDFDEEGNWLPQR